MSTPRFYLVRQRNERILGPMTLGALVESVKTLALAPGDEVAGHLGAWVRLGDGARVRQNYSELAKALEKARLLWADPTVSVGPQTLSPEVMSTDGRRSPDPALRRKRPWRRRLGAATVVLGVLVGGVTYLRLSGRLGEEPMPPALQALLSESRRQLRDGQVEEVLKAMDRSGADVVAFLVAHPGQADRWLPILRAYAYSKDGVLTGLSSLLLRGDGGFAALPLDCTFRSWLRRWRADFGTLASGTLDALASEAAVVLALDPHWVRRRPGEGWVEPQSYAHACLRMARDSLVEFLSEGSLGAEGLARGDELLARLEWQIQASSAGGGGGPSRGPPDKAGSRGGRYLGGVTCLEQAQTLEGLDTCRRDAVAASVEVPGWSEVYERLSWPQVFRVVLQSGGGVSDWPTVDWRSLYSYLSLDSDALQRPGQAMPLRTPSYEPEARYIRELVKTQGNATEALRAVEGDFPGIDFSR